MLEAARAFALIALALAFDSARAGAPLADEQRIVEEANRAVFEHLVATGQRVHTIASPDGAARCPAVFYAGRVGSLCRKGPDEDAFPNPVKSRVATCPACLSSLGVLGVVMRIAAAEGQSADAA